LVLSAFRFCLSTFRFQLLPSRAFSPLAAYCKSLVAPSGSTDLPGCIRKPKNGQSYGSTADVLMSK
jgi:hypothetical protein